jgi:hypothetical protein
MVTIRARHLRGFKMSETDIVPRMSWGNFRKFVFAQGFHVVSEWEFQHFDGMRWYLVAADPVRKLLLFAESLPALMNDDAEVVAWCRAYGTFMPRRGAHGLTLMKALTPAKEAIVRSYRRGTLVVDFMVEGDVMQPFLLKLGSYGDFVNWHLSSDRHIDIRSSMHRSNGVDWDFMDYLESLPPFVRKFVRRGSRRKTHWGRSFVGRMAP